MDETWMCYLRRYRSVSLTGNASIAGENTPAGYIPMSLMGSAQSDARRLSMLFTVNNDDLAAHILDYFRCGAAKEDTMYQIACYDEIIHTSEHPICGDASCPCHMQAIKYITFTGSWVHIASGQPFAFVAGRYGRYSKTLCGHLYEMDDYSKVENVEYAESKLCKRCAQQKRLTLRGPDVDLSYERSAQ